MQAPSRARRCSRRSRAFCRALPEAEGCDVDPRAVLPLAFDAFANDDQLLDYERRVEHVSSRDHYKKNILYVEVYQARDLHNEIRMMR